jgi:hypothetical protein
MHTSKEIARRLEVSPHTVDERLKRATAILGASTRFEAARMYLASLDGSDRSLFDWENQHQSLVYQSPGLADQPFQFMFDPSPDTKGRSGDGGTDDLQEPYRPYYGAVDQRASRISLWSAFLDATWENKLSSSTRVAAIILIAFLAIVGVGSLVSIAEGLSRLV